MTRVIGFAWVVATLLAAAFQVARNGLQRSLMADGGPWGATLVRFLFGLPFSLGLAVIAVAATPSAHASPSPKFWITAGLGAGAQILATASLLVAMRRAGFTVATALQQSSLPLAAILGLTVFHDRLGAVAWIGVAVCSAGLATLAALGRGRPDRASSGPRPLSGAAFGLLSGLAFGFSLNAFRHAGQALEPAHPVFAAVVTVLVVQLLQTLALGGALLAFRPQVVVAVLRSWRPSLGAGLCGSLASTGWFVALALAPAAPLRAVGVAEAPMAALAGRRLFKERLSPWQWAAGAGIAFGVVLTALG
jgi:drug/metabolite transporter (DMT)-like permease